MRPATRLHSTMRASSWKSSFSISAIMISSGWVVISSTRSSTWSTAFRSRTAPVTKWDVVYLVRRMIMINNLMEDKDDIDHLGNRRVKTVGELIQNKLRIGLRRMERVIKERMSIRDQDQISPVSLVNIRPVVAALREFFGSSQLSQFMDQTNPLAELRHKRTLSALGSGRSAPRARRFRCARCSPLALWANLPGGNA
jgi:DNA-directed RNA polymerase beta subunit